MSGRVQTARRVLVAAAFAAGTAAARVAAQSPAERAGLDSLRAALETVTDSTALLAREQARIAVARQNREDPLLHLELGFIAYRLGAVTGQRKHYDDAAGEFEWASELRPNWPYPWYWLGQAELALGESRVIPLENLRQILGVDELSKAARAFARAAQADPSFGRALVDLGTTALRQRIAPRLAVAQRALRLAAGTAVSEQPAVLLVRGRVERELDANDSALAAFRAYLSRGGDPALGGLEVARSLYTVGQPDSAIAGYFAAAAHRPVGDSARAEFRREVFWVASVEDLRAFDVLPDDSIGPWLRRFWGRRDVADARLPGDRLVEQFRRYAYARKNFRLVSRHRHYDIAEIYRDSVQSEFDDRGVIYLRHGEPDARARFVGDTIVHPNESWAYRRPLPEGDLIFHFVSRGHVQDYKIVGSLLDAYDFSTAVALASPSDSSTNAVRGLLLSRSGLSPVYERLAFAGFSGRSRLLAEERREVQRSEERGTTTDSYPLRFSRDLRPVVTSFVVADSAGRGNLHIVFAIPAGALAPVPVTSGGVAYPLRLRVVVFDDQQREIAGLDTLRVFRAAAQLPSGSYLTEQLAVPVAAGTYRFHFVAEEVSADAGALVPGQTVTVPALGGPFTASDLVLGRVGSGLVWRRPEGEVPLNPLMRYPRDGTLELYYELYGLPERAAVVTHVAVTPRSRGSLLSRVFGRRSGVRLEYTTQTDAPGLSRVRQRIELAGLAAGRYDLAVTLRDPATGTQVVRSQSFEITGQRAP
jgi:tetratricopeptide (TPR) repeat protein